MTNYNFEPTYILNLLLFYTSVIHSVSSIDTNVINEVRLKK